MDAAAEPPAQSRSRTRHSHAPASTPPTYGYHNTYHTHAQLPAGSPPSYARACDPKVLRHLHEKARAEAEAVRCGLDPPPYSCSVELGGILGVRPELASPFQVAANRQWYDAYVVLHGTQLLVHRVRSPGLLSRNRNPSPGRLLRKYTLQHAEIGVASDFKKTPLIPRTPFGHLVPSSARAKLYETDPQLFETVREHVIRLRLETEQFLLCASSQEEMLSWIEALCAAIDISAPLEDRSEPRYRSLPRRSRRQRVLDGAALGEDLENLSSLDAGRRVIAQQEQIIRTLYPHLGGARDGTAVTAVAPSPHDETEDFDPEDVRFPSRPNRNSDSHTPSSDDETIPTARFATTANPKQHPTPIPSASQTLRYRRRCAPVLLASSPRVSDVVYHAGQRHRISVKEHALVSYTAHPPRYDAHGFPKHRARRPARLEGSVSTSVVAAVAVPSGAPVAGTKASNPRHGETLHHRPASPMRVGTEDTLASLSFGEDLAIALAPSHSRTQTEAETENEQEIETGGEDEIGVSGPPSPTAVGHGKGLGMGIKMGGGEEGGVGDAGFRAVALGVGLLI